MIATKRRIAPEIDPDQLIPLPMPIAIGMAFIPSRYKGKQFEERIKKLARKHLNPISKDWNAPGFLTIYDARIWKLIREVMTEN